MSVNRIFGKYSPSAASSGYHSGKNLKALIDCINRVDMKFALFDCLANIGIYHHVVFVLLRDDNPLAAGKSEEFTHRKEAFELLRYPADRHNFSHLVYRTGYGNSLIEWGLPYRRQ